MKVPIRSLYPSRRHVRGIFYIVVHNQVNTKYKTVETYIRAASYTASRAVSSENFSFSSSVFASCRPFPTAAPLYPCVFTL